jgi:hypothetical protein
VSGLLSGEIGRSDEAAPGALWLGETWAMRVGAMTDVPTFVHGMPVPDGPNQIDRTWLLGADVILRPLEGRLETWVGAGRFDIDASGTGPYDRTLYYWILEVVADGSLVSPWLDPIYLALRANGLTTGDASRGFLLDVRLADSVGHNVRNLAEYSAALGVVLNEWVRIRGEYVYQDIDLVSGLPPSIASQRNNEHWFAFDVGISF